MTKFPLTAFLGGALAATALSLSIPAPGHADSGPAAGGSSGAAPPSRNASPPPTKRTGAHPRTNRGHNGAAAPNSAASTAGVWAPVLAVPALEPTNFAALKDAIRTGRIDSTSPVPGLDDSVSAPTSDLVPNDGGLSEAQIAELLGITAGGPIGQ